MHQVGISRQIHIWCTDTYTSKVFNLLEFDAPLTIFFVFSHVPKIAKGDYYRRYVSPPVRPSVRMEQLCSHWMDFHEIWHLNISPKSDEKIQDFLNSDKKKLVLYMKTNTYLRSRLAHFFFRMRIFLDKICREIQNTNFMVNFFFFEIVLFMK